MDDRAKVADERLQAALDRQATEHDQAAWNARRDRRAVWLRLKDEHGLRYMDLAVLTGYGTTTLYKEIRLARKEHAEIHGSVREAR